MDAQNTFGLQHFTSGMVEKGAVGVSYFPTRNTIAGILTNGIRMGYLWKLKVCAGWLVLQVGGWIMTVCRKCRMSFRSHNELRKHIRANGHVCGELEEVGRPAM